MSSFWGMDTEQARSHADALRTGSTRLHDLSGRLEGSIRGVEWTGPDAEEFLDRWEQLRTGLLEASAQEISAHGDRLEGEAAQQDTASGGDGASDQGETGSPGGAATGGPQEMRSVPHSPSERPDAGYLHTDNPWIPNWLEQPAEALLADTAQVTSDLIGWGGEKLADAISGVANRLGLEMGGFEQFRRDAAHTGEMITEWATGERVPTFTELLAGSLVTLGSGGVAGYEMLTGEDTPFLDDRPGGQVLGITTDSSPQTSPQSLQDLVLGNNALRMDNPGGPLESGQIGIQEVHSADRAEPAYIVQIPPTEGAEITDFPDAWGAQGNSRDWASNLRSMSGQDTPALQDVRAAMAEAGIPPGSDVMFVGHSQGGIVGNHLAADPSFNNTSGAEGSYNITHAFSVGSPIQTVHPAQTGTTAVNVSHEIEGSPGDLSGDYIAGLDFGGAQVNGGRLEVPNRHEVSLPGYPQPTWNPIEVLHHDHDAVGTRGEHDLGYAGTVGRNELSDPTLSAFRQDIEGVYIGDGTYVASSQVVEVSRGTP